MKICSFNRLLLLSLAALPFTAQATPLIWDITAGDGAAITDSGGTWSNGTGNWNDGAANVNWNNATPDSATFTGATGGTITTCGTITQAGMIFNGNANYTVTGSSIGGVGSLTKNGTGTLTLSSANGFTGGTTVSAGGLRYNAYNAMGSSASTITLGDANTGANNISLAYNFGSGGWGNALPNVTVANVGSGNTVTISLPSTVNGYSAGNLTLNRSATITSGATSGGNYVCGPNGKITGNLGGGTLTLQCTGAGALYIGSGGVNDFIGTVAMPQGKVSLFSATSLGTGNPVVMSGTGALDLRNFSQSIGALTGVSANTIALGSGSLTISSADSVNFAGAISGTGGLTKNGGGTQTLSGINTYTGATTISGGILKIDGSGKLGSGTYAGAITNTAALQYSSSANQTLSGIISGVGGTLTKDTGSGALTLSNNNSYTGATTVSAGTLAVSGSLTGGGAITAQTNGIFAITSTGTVALSDITVKDTGTLRVEATGKTLKSVTVENGGILNLAATSGATTTVTNALAFTGTPAFTVKPVFPGAPAVGTYDLLSPGSVSGSSGTITTDLGIYSNTRTYIGSTALTGGKLVLTMTTGGSAASLTWNNGGGTGQWSLISTPDNNFDNAGSNDIFYNQDTVTFAGAAPGTVTLVGSLSPAAVHVTSSTGDYTFVGSGGIGGTTALNKSGGSTLAINTNNSYSGGTNLTAGTLALGHSGALGTTGSISFGGGTLQYSAANTTDYSARFSTAAGQQYRIDTNGQSVTFGTALNSSGATLTKKGAGTLTLSSNSTYAGGTIVSAGTLKTTADSALGTGSITLNDANTLAQDTTFTTTANTGASPVSNAIIVANQGTGTTTLELAAPNAQLGVPSIQLNKATTIQANFNGGGGAYVGKYDGSSVVSGNVGTLTLRALGTGQLYFVGNNTFTGTVQITQGTVATQHVNALGGSGNSVVMSGSATLRPGAFGTALAIGDLTGSATNTISNDGQLLTISSANSADFAGTIAGGGGLTKDGGGTQTLSGTNTYTGTTIVSAGTLLVTGALGNTATSVASSATLTGTGTVGGTVSLDAGGTLGGTLTISSTVSTGGATSVIAPGNSPGTLTVGALNATNGANFDFELGATSDLLAITGVLTVGSNPLTFDFLGAGVVDATPYTLFTFASQTGLDYSDLSATTLPAGKSLDTTFGTGGWQINGSNLQVQFVPEPSAALLGALGALALLRRRRA